jgi:hypothetical protein
MSRSSNVFSVAVVDGATSDLPSWADYTALPAGKFREFTLNTPNDSKPAHYAGVVADQVFNSWTGADYIPEHGTHGAVGYHGGGTHDPQPEPTGVIVLDIGARQFHWRNQSLTVRSPWKGATCSGEPTDQYGHYVADGLSPSPHVYGCICRVPAAWGLTGPGGGLARIGESAGDSRKLAEPCGTNDSWASTTVFDIATVSGGHKRITGADIAGSGTYHFGSGSGNPSFQQGGGSCVDMIRQGWWTKARNEPYLNFTHRSGAITKYTTKLALAPDFPFLHHFADTDVLVCFGDQTNARHVWVCRPAIDTAWTLITPVFADKPGISFYPGYMGPRWSTLLNCFVGIEYHKGLSDTTGGATTHVWKLTPPPPASLITGRWTWSKEPVASADGSQILTSDPSCAAGSWGKLVECPTLRALVWTRGAGSKGQLIRLQGM